MKECEKCGAYLIEDAICNCRPFKVYIPDDDDTFTLYGIDVYDIAERAAEWYNADDPVVDDNVFIKPIEITDEQGHTLKFQCFAELDILYKVRAVVK